LNLSPTQDEKLDTLRRELGEVYDGLPSLKRKVEALPNEKTNTDPSRGPLLRKIDRLIGLGSHGKDKDAYRLFDNAKERKHDESHPSIFQDQNEKIDEEVVYLSKAELIKPSTIIVVDLGNTAQQDIINIVALDILSKLERAKASVQRADRTKVAIFIEEAHTFFSAEYTGNDQIARSLTNIVKRIFKIGRKFYLNPVVISQQPSDVPKGILSQCNTKIVHQLSDDDDISKVTKGSARVVSSILV
jgi:hypothetical protein